MHVANGEGGASGQARPWLRTPASRAVRGTPAPPGPWVRTHRPAPAQAQRQAPQAALAVRQATPAQLGQHGESTAVTGLQTQVLTLRPAPPILPSPMPTLETQWQLGPFPGGLGIGDPRVIPATGIPGGGWRLDVVLTAAPSGEDTEPHLGQHVAAVPMHCVRPLVERGEVSASQHRAGARARNLLAAPLASGAGAGSRERPCACQPVAPSPQPPPSPSAFEQALPRAAGTSTQTGAHRRLSGDHRPTPRPPGGRDEQRPGHSTQKGPSQGASAGAGQGLGSYQLVQSVE